MLSRKLNPDWYSAHKHPSMDLRLNREIKHFCLDFRPIRKILRTIEAVSLGRRKQVDYFYNLPDASNTLGARRLKLRVEHRSTYLVYYYDKHQSGTQDLSDTGSSRSETGA